VVFYGWFKFFISLVFFMSIETSVVGSFPKFEGSLDEAIKKVVNVQLNFGIDVITDGEQRGSMVSYFEQLSGLEKTGKKVKTILEGLNRDEVKVKITFTGPMTLGTICALTDKQSAQNQYSLDDNRKMYFDFSEALLPLVLRALELGALVQIDEPLLSTGSINLVEAKEVLEKFFKKVPSSVIRDEKISLHVCGSIKAVPGLFDVLLGLPVLVLSLGFSGKKERENMDIISKRVFEDNNKKLGAGFISNINIENQKITKERYFEIEKRVGKENIKYLHPDCGFALASTDKVNQILENMRVVSNLII